MKGVGVEEYTFAELTRAQGHNHGCKNRKRENGVVAFGNRR
jgi:hypothetical protein